jgi:probable HAF family extracellular repeat protein
MTSPRLLTITLAGCLLASSLVLPAPAAQAAARVHKVELGTLGGTVSAAADINDHGVVVGYSTTRSGAQHAFMWQHNKMTDLKVGGTGSRAEDINNYGQIVGIRTLANGDTHGFRWQHGRVTDLGLISGGSVFINERGQVAGTGAVDFESTAFIWQQGVRTYLPKPPFWCCAVARGINDHGQVIGTAISGESFEDGLLWDDGTVTKLGGLSTGIEASFPLGINNRGQVTGYSFTDDGTHAFRWQNGTMSDLGTLPGGRHSEAVDINAVGQVTGVSGTAIEGTDHAFLSRPGGLIDLGALDAQNSVANALNDCGEVVGELQRPTGDENFSVSAFAWQHGVMTDLGRGLPYDTRATGVNNLGQIIGSATRNGSDKAVLWTIT